MSVEYIEICNAVWELFESQRQKLIPGGGQRNLLFPPPPRNQSVDLLIVGISPNHNAAIGYSNERNAIERFAHEFEYISGSENSGRRLHYDAYYGKLMELVRRINPDFGVWKEVERGRKRLLVEFTDCLHIATTPGDSNDIWQLFNRRRMNCRVWAACKEILEREFIVYDALYAECQRQVRRR